MNIQILVVDLGSQYTDVIGRIHRELGVRPLILPPKRAAAWLKKNKPKGIVLSGGSASVHDEDAPVVPKEVLAAKVPVLGICYGMQWLAHKRGGRVVSRRENKEYGKTQVVFDRNCRLFRTAHRQSVVWASHGDSVAVLPKGFCKTATSDSGKTTAAMANPKAKIWGVQFHPEVTQTKDGKKMIKQFLFDICGCERDWFPQDIIAGIENEIATAVGDGEAVIGFSGGVDSSTLTTIGSRALGKRLLAVCIDTGGLRQGELFEVRQNARYAGVNLRVVKAAGRFYEALRGVSHSEVKRRRFKQPYGAILQREALRFGRNKGSVVLIQGTLATDEIESGKGEAEVIKSHHNVGHNWKVRQIHPLRHLFKYEVRDLARQLKLPDCITLRMPFPGPGLFIRVVGKPVTPKLLAIVRWADAEVTRILKNHKLYHRISQLVVALNCNRTVGIKGDERVYDYSIWVRAVVSSDFMTAVGYQISAKVRREIDSCLTKHPEIVAVDFRETHKPPATVEME